MPDILDEAVSDLKEERKLQLLKSYGKYVLLTTIVAIIILVTYLWWDSYQANKLNKQGGEFMQACMKLHAGNVPEGVAELKELMAQDTVYATLAGLHYAAYMSYSKNYSTAYKIYNNIANTKKIDVLFNNYADFMQLNIALISGAIDEQAAITKLKEYVAEKPIFKLTAQKSLAALLIKNQKNTEAQDIINSTMESQDISDDHAAKKLLFLLP